MLASIMLASIMLVNKNCKTGYTIGVVNIKTNNLCLRRHPIFSLFFSKGETSLIKQSKSCSLSKGVDSWPALYKNLSKFL